MTGSIKMTPSVDRANYGSVEDTVTYLVLAERGPGCPDPMFFDRAIIGWPSMLERMRKACGIYGNYSTDNLANQIRNLRGAIVTSPRSPGGKFELLGGRELDVMARQKVLSRHSYKNSEGTPISTLARVVSVRSVKISESGRAINQSGSFYYDHDGRWFPIAPTNPDDLVEDVGFGIAILQAGCSRRLWGVSIRFAPMTPSVVLYSDARGLADFFRFRNVPEGKTRRDALAHWVSQHWRQDRDDPEAEIYVREHLRGSRQFGWHGLGVEMEIPPVDLDRAERAAVERVAMGREKSRRPRLPKR